MDIMKRLLASRLEILRGEMTKQQFARMLGIPQNSYLRYEDVEDSTLPKVDILEKVCRKCGASADWLLGLKENVATDNGALSRAEAAESKLKAVKKSLIALVRDL